MYACMVMYDVRTPFFLVSIKIPLFELYITCNLETISTCITCILPLRPTLYTAKHCVGTWIVLYRTGPYCTVIYV